MDMPPVDAAALLDRLASAPFIIEAPSSPTDVRTGVIAAFAKRQADRSADRIANVFHSRSTAGKVDIDLYRAAIADVKDQVDREINKDGGYLIEFVDVAAKDMRQEISRLSKLTTQGKEWRKDANSPGAKQGGVSFNLAKTGGGRTCFVSPFHPRIDVDAVLKEMTGVEVNRGDMAPVDFHKQVTWHEVGHCLLGASEMKSDIFAALMTVRSTSNKDMLQRWAMWRESNELQTRDLFDDHDTSKGVWPVVRMQDDLRANPEFMALDIHGLAALANTMGDRYAFTADETMLMREVRIALLAIGEKKVHYLPSPGGVTPVDMGEWMAGRPELRQFGRLFELTEALHKGTVVNDPPALDRKAFKSTLQKLAKDGDPTAKAALAAMAELAKVAPKVMKMATARAEFMDRNVPRQGKSDTELTKKLINYNPSCQSITYSADQATFAVRDADSGKIISAGQVVKSLEGMQIALKGRWMNGRPVSQELAADEPSGLRPGLR